MSVSASSNQNAVQEDTSGKIGAYFPQSWTPDMIPPGFYNLNKPKPVITAEGDQQWMGHNKILPTGQCVVCSDAKNMKKCFGQMRTCELTRSNQVCYTEVRVDDPAQGSVLINRGCRERTGCLTDYHNNVRFGGRPELKSINGKRPRQQCRYIGRGLARNTLLQKEWINRGQKCVSCHKNALSVPYL